MYVSVLEGGLGGALGVDGGWLPLPTRPQRYCDPASLVIVTIQPLEDQNKQSKLIFEALETQGTQ